MNILHRGRRHQTHIAARATTTQEQQRTSSSNSNALAALALPVQKIYLSVELPAASWR
jgi:hypothetical protein